MNSYQTAIVDYPEDKLHKVKVQILERNENVTRARLLEKRSPYLEGAIVYIPNKMLVLERKFHGSET